MGNDAMRSKSTKAQKPVASSKTADKAKNLLIIYKPSSERSNEIMDHFYDALNQVKPAGCVAILRSNAVNLSDHDEEYVKTRTSQWLMSPSNVGLVCISTEQADQIPREAFTDESGILPSKIFPLCFGTEIPPQWPECYALGLANP